VRAAIKILSYEAPRVKKLMVYKSVLMRNNFRSCRAFSVSAFSKPLSSMNSANSQISGPM